MFKYPVALKARGKKEMIVTHTFMNFYFYFSGRTGMV